MPDYIQNNFTSGMISPMYRRRADLGSYNFSARLMENLLPMATGGFTLRWHTDFKLKLDGAKRIIPFIVSSDDALSEKYILALYPSTEENSQKIEIYFVNETLEGETTFEPVTTENIKNYPFTGGLEDIQFAQDYSKIILVNSLFRPYVIERTDLKKLKGDFLQLNTEYMFLDEPDTKLTYSYNEGKETKFDSAGNYPRCVAFCANRLYLASTTVNPYTIWISRPFEYNNFQTITYYHTVDEALETEQYINAAKGSREYDTDKGTAEGDLSRTHVVVKVDDDGLVTTTKTFFDSSGNPIMDGDKPKTEIEQYNYLKPKFIVSKEVTPDCAMILDVGSDMNETIKWIKALDNIYVGTSASEWVMPIGMTAQNPMIQHISSYGSHANINSLNGANSIFFTQRGGKGIRNITSQGIVNVSVQCREIFDIGIKDIVFQSVPEQRLYAILKNGKVAVLGYDPMLGQLAWAIWTFAGEVMSMAVLDSIGGQKLYALIDRDGAVYLEEFNEKDSFGEDCTGLVVDGNPVSYPFKGILETNSIDALQTIGMNKKIYNIWLDADGNDFLTGCIGSSLENAVSENNMVKVPIFSVITDDELRIRVESIPGKPLTVLALLAELGA